MNAFNNLNLRNKFILVFSLFAVPLIILLVVLLLMTKAGFEDQSAQLATQLTNEISSSLQTQFEAYQDNSTIISGDAIVSDNLGVLSSTASTAEQKQAATAELNDELPENSELYGYSATFLTSTKGTVVYTTDYSDDLIGVDLSVRDYIQTALNGQANWSSLFYSSFVGDNVMLYALPVYGSTGQLEGTYCIMFEQNVIDNLVNGAVAAAGIQDYTTAYLINQDGIFLTNEYEDEEGSSENSVVPLETVNETESTTILAPEISAGNTDFSEIAYYTNYKGTDVLASLNVISPSGSPIGLALEFDTAVTNATFNSLIIIEILVFIVLIGMAVVNILTLNIVGKSLGFVVENLEKVSNYDLGVEIPEKLAKRNDEIGKLSQSMVQQINNLKELVKGIQENSERLASSSEELNAIAQQSSEASDDVSKTIDDIAGSASEQAKNTTESAAKLNKFGEVVHEEVQDLAQLSSTTSDINSLADEGLNILNKLETTSQTQYDMTQTVRNSIIKTNESSMKIQEASNLITDIADQTTLLALNAAIEAANAGEYGKGFAVVAEEIRQLAEQSGDSTKQIDSIVRELISDSGEAVNAINTTQDIVDEQQKDMQETKSKYLEIMNNIEDVDKRVDGINDSTNYMAKENVNIQELIQGLAAIAEENAAGTQEASAAAEEQTASMEEISNATDELAQLATDLQTMTNKFTF
jgi:methyl-accepting chemotaxis protein